MEYEMIGGTHELLYVPSLQKRMHQNLSRIGGYSYTPEEKAFAEEISKTLNRKLNTEFIEGVVPYETPEKPGVSLCITFLPGAPRYPPFSKDLCSHMMRPGTPRAHPECINRFERFACILRTSAEVRPKLAKSEQSF